MKLHQEQRIQGLMILTSFIGMVTALGLIIAGLVQNHMPYMFYAAIDLVIVFVIIAIGSHWTQKTVARVKMIRSGAGDDTDLEWVTRKK